MPNLKAYSNRTLQEFFALTMQFEAEGITDGRFIRQQLHNSIREDAVVARVERAKVRHTLPKREVVNRSSLELCPSCHKPTLQYKASSIEGFPVVYCRCGFSQPTEVR